MRKLWVTVSVPAEPKDWSLLKLQHTGLCGFPWRQPASPLRGLDSCPAAEGNNRILVFLLAWCVGRRGKLWTFIHNLTFLYKVKIQMLIPTVFHFNDLWRNLSSAASVCIWSERCANMAFFSINWCWWFGFLFKFHFLFCFVAVCVFCEVQNRKESSDRACCWDCMTPVIQLLLQREFCLPATTFYRNLGWFFGFIFRESSELFTRLLISSVVTPSDYREDGC